MKDYKDNLSYKTIDCEACGMDNYHYVIKFKNVFFCDNDCLVSFLSDLGDIRLIYIKGESEEV